MQSAEEQLALIRRGVDRIVPEDELRQKLERSVKTDTPLRIKYGIDPTGFDVHLGHTVPLRKLRLFQELGHKAVLILGDWTAMLGDPSGRDESRKGLTREQIEANAATYLTQIGRIIDTSRAEVRCNGEWFGKFTLTDVLTLTSQITVQRLLERDDFTKRIKDGAPIYVSECLYPLMQGRDSVEIRADVELGGSEQLYNLLVGRNLQSDAGQPPQVCLTMPILKGLDGEKKMGKSLGNYIGVAETANDMVNKTMSIADTLMPQWFELLTDRSREEIARLCDPTQTLGRDAKLILGGDIARFYHGEEAAKVAVAEWIKTKSRGEDPTDIPDVEVPAAELSDGQIWVCKLLVRLGLSSGTKAAGRDVEGGGVTLGPAREKVTDPKVQIAVANGLIVRVGKRKIARVRLV